MKRPVDSVRPLPSLALVLLGAFVATGCAGSLPLDPAFAPRAEELPTTARGGFWPNAPVVMGTSTFTNVGFAQRDPQSLVLPGVRIQVGHTGFRLTFDRQENGAPASHVVCEGGPTDDDPKVEAVRCTGDGSPSAFALIASSSGRGSLYVGNVSDPAGKPIWALDRAPLPQGKAVGGNVTGYVLRRGDTIEATLDLSYLGRPKTWIARELGAADRAAALGVLASVYFLRGKTETRDP